MFLPKTNFIFFNFAKNDIVFYSRIICNCNVNKITKSNYSDLSQHVSALRRGTGGRSSFSGIVATVFGATGFLGKYVVNELGKIGSQIIIPYRGTAYDVRELRVMGDLGQVLFLPLKVDDDESIRKAIKYSNVVINLIGKDTETKNFSHERVHVDIAARIARISKEMGVEKLIHVSSLNAQLKVPEYLIKNGSSFLRTKALGEVEVKREYPEAIIFRPSDIYGHNDRFLMYFIKWERRYNILDKTYIPLWRHGKETFKQPVCAIDVAKGIKNAVCDPSFNSTIIEAVGPHRYRLDHFIWWVYLTLRYHPDKLFITDVYFFTKIKTKILQSIKPIYPNVSLDKLERECHTDEILDFPSLEDLGVNLTNLEDRLFFEIRFKRKLNNYMDAVGEIAEISPPPRAVY